MVSNMKSNFLKKISMLFVAGAVITVASTTNIASQQEVDESAVVSTFDLLTGYSYAQYLEDLGAIANSVTNEIVIPASDYVVETAIGVSEVGDVVETKQASTVEYVVEIAEAGFYNIEVDYLPLEGSGSTIVRELYIDGALPFWEASTISFERHWVDETKEWLMQTDQNYAAPSQMEEFVWQTKTIESSDRRYDGNFQFYFDKGEHSIEFVGVSEPVAFGEIRLKPAEVVPSYEEFKTTIDESQVVGSDVLSEAIIVQGEDSISKSSSVLLPINDRTSAKTQPYHSSNIVMNAIGGQSWKTPGTEITWVVDVPQEGYYKLAVRFKQSYNRDFYSMREIKINDEVQFLESNGVRFNYDTAYQLDYVGNEVEDYYFKLEEGENTITMSVSLGHLGEMITAAQEVVKDFNELYRELVAVMGTSPDIYRDYKIEQAVPSFVPTLEKNKVILEEILANFGDGVEQGGKTNELNALLLQINQLIEKPGDIAEELAILSANISAVGEWSLALGDQQLTVDYLMVTPDDYTLPAGEANFFEGIGHTVSQFLGSFTNDYTVVAEGSSEKEENIEVWLAVTARDQYDVVQRMINEHFADSEYSVTLKMVAADTITPSTLTGDGPDVAIQVNSTMPTEFAYRGASYDLTQFEDFEEVADRFAPGAMEYFSYQDGYYALPDQMSFPVIFYREDILEQLGLEVPQTWDEVLAMIPYLQAENLSIYFDAKVPLTLGGVSTNVTKQVNSIYLSMLYQQGLELYRDQGDAVNFNTELALETFEDWTDYYTKQGFEVDVNFTTRFRTGEIPLAIVDYTYYNTLVVGAPEIAGEWSIAPIPGTMDENGTIDSSVAGITGACMMIKETVENNDTIDEAWDFMKWWTSEEIQVEYAMSLEAVLGPAARYPVSNLAAIDDIIIDEDIYETMITSAENMRGIPQVPGGYITGRYLESAFLEVYNENINPIDALYDRVADIDAELTKKRVEFDLE